MTSSTSIEPFITFSRRSLLVLLIAFLWLAATCVAVAFFPESIVARWPIRAPWLFPVAMIGGWAALRATLRGHRWDPQIAKVMKDEFRQSNMLRAQRAAFFTVMLLQAPLTLAFGHVPATRALITMAGTTITTGMSVLTAVFLYLDRE